MPKLRYFSTEGKWVEHELGKHTSIGRHPESSLQLLDRMISKEHAEVTYENGVYVIRDVGSRNGTTLNDESLETPHVLRDGDHIGMGNHDLLFIDDSAAPETEPDSVPLKTSDDTAAVPKLEPASQDSPSLSDSGQDFLGKDETNEITNLPVMFQQIPAVKKSMQEAKFLPADKLSQEKLCEDYEKLRAAAELSTEVASTVDFNVLIHIIIEKAFKLFKADRAAILLKGDDGKMHTKIAVDKNYKDIHHFKISETLLEVVLNEKTAVLSEDMLEDKRFSTAKSIVVNNVRSTMCVPLLYENEIQGVINLDTQITAGVFEEKDLLILTGFARQAAFTLQQAHMIEQSKKNAVIRDNLKRIIPRHLIDDVMSGKIELQKSGHHTEATVLFADIRGFTHMTEQSSPEMIVDMLNDFFERMVDCIFTHGGALDKFVGDEVMAVWGVNVSLETHAQNAVKCAIAMMEAVDELNVQREKDQLPPCQIGIGIATGPMIAGYMGSTQAMSYTVIGDTVNLGARLCAAAQPGEILINGSASNSLSDDMETMPLPPIMLKGKRDPVEVFRVLR